MKVVANDISYRFTNMIQLMDKEEEKEKPKPVTNDILGINYLSGVGSNTIDLIGEPAVQSFFQTRRQDEATKNETQRVVSTGVDFHKTYVP